MTRDDVNRMWAEALRDIDTTDGAIHRFAALVAATEREACAKVCETTEDCNPHYAAAIRARAGDSRE